MTKKTFRLLGNLHYIEEPERWGLAGDAFLSASLFGTRENYLFEGYWIYLICDNDDEREGSENYFGKADKVLTLKPSAERTGKERLLLWRMD